MVLWLPSWQVATSLAASGRLAESAGPAAVLRGSRVSEVTASAAHAGVDPGMRQREAQSRCPEIVLVRADDAAASSMFDRVLELVEQVVPRVEAIRPGSCLIPAYGPARFYGGEAEAARRVAAAVRDGSELAQACGVRVAIADDVFTAGQAVRSAAESPVIVESGASRSFLAPLPVECLPDAELASLLRRLGVATLGQFADLDDAAVAARFGEWGMLLHARVRGADARRPVPRERHEDIALHLEWEDPVDREDQVAFAARAPAAEFTAALLRRGVAATAIRVSLVTEGGRQLDRVWNHPQCFDEVAIVDRVRWQVQALASSGGLPEAEDAVLSGGVVRLSVTPERVEEAYRLESPLFGSGVQERVVRGLARVQALVGFDGVLQVRVGGGRSIRDRIRAAPWGEALPAVPGDGPWPERLPSPAPSIVYEHPLDAGVFDRAGRPVVVDARGSLSAPIACLAVSSPAGERRHRITSWAGPWPVLSSWWGDAVLSGVVPGSGSPRADRFQCVDTDAVGWLVVCRAGRWQVEGRYD